jgi:hypothetical protein
MAGDKITDYASHRGAFVIFTYLKKENGQTGTC